MDQLQQSFKLVFYSPYIFQLVIIGYSNHTFPVNPRKCADHDTPADVEYRNAALSISSIRGPYFIAEPCMQLVQSADAESGVKHPD